MKLFSYTDFREHPRFFGLSSHLCFVRPWCSLPCGCATEDWHVSFAESRKSCSSCGRTAPEDAGDVACIYDLLSIVNFLDSGGAEAWLVPEEILQKDSARCFDVVQDDCCHSLCFTKAYGRYIDGTGSVYVSPVKLKESSKDPGSYAMQEFCGALRYFSPSEVARLLGFKLTTEDDHPRHGDEADAPSSFCRASRRLRCLPLCQKHPVKSEACEACHCENFQLPAEPSRARELWALLGNSLNPQVVGLVCVACELPKLCPQSRQRTEEKVGTALA